MRASTGELAPMVPKGHARHPLCSAGPVLGAPPPVCSTIRLWRTHAPRRPRRFRASSPCVPRLPFPASSRHGALVAPPASWCLLGLSPPCTRAKQVPPASLVPPSWSLTTSTVCSARPLQVCCTLLPTLGFVAFPLASPPGDPKVSRGSAFGPRDATDPSKGFPRQELCRVTAVGAPLPFPLLLASHPRVFCCVAERRLRGFAPLTNPSRPSPWPGMVRSFLPWA